MVQRTLASAAALATRLAAAAADTETVRVSRAADVPAGGDDGQRRYMSTGGPVRRCVFVPAHTSGERIHDTCS